TRRHVTGWLAAPPAPAAGRRSARRICPPGCPAGNRARPPASRAPVPPAAVRPVLPSWPRVLPTGHADRELFAAARGQGAHVLAEKRETTAAWRRSRHLIAADTQTSVIRVVSPSARRPDPAVHRDDGAGHPRSRA